VLVGLLVKQGYRGGHRRPYGMTVTDVARRNAVPRQTLHTWLHRSAGGGMAALADESSKPESRPHASGLLAPDSALAGERGGCVEVGVVGSEAKQAHSGQDRRQYGLG
jgi:hypothetical protein